MTEPRSSIDFNCDLGEGCGSDAAIVPLISSASIACGGHAGDADTMRETLLLCAEHNVAAGAHPSYPDRENFGRVSMALAADELRASLLQQMLTLQNLAAATNVPLRHVKPHGALYNDAARDIALADVVLDVVSEVNSSLRIVGLAGSAFVTRARERGFEVREEAFVERGYQANGHLAPRGTPGAVLDSVNDSLQQFDDIVCRGSVRAVTGESVSLRADTVCLHGDRVDAVDFAQHLREYLDEMGIEVKA